MIEVFGIILVCILIDSFKLMSIIYFSIGIGIIGAIDYISQKKIPIKKSVYYGLQISSIVFISLSLLNEASIYSVLFVILGMSIFYYLYNVKKANKIGMLLLLLVACFFIDIAFYQVLSIVRFLLFTICTIAYFAFIYLKKPCGNLDKNR